MFASSNSVSSVDADAKSFVPISRTWNHALIGDASAAYSAGEVEIARPGKDLIKMASETTVYDNEQAMYVMRRLPLEVGYKATVPLVSSLGGSAVPFPLAVEVTTKELVEVPAGKFGCFNVALNIGQTLWFSVD